MLQKQGFDLSFSTNAGCLRPCVESFIHVFGIDSWQNENNLSLHYLSILYHFRVLQEYTKKGLDTTQTSDLIG